MRAEPYESAPFARPWEVALTASPYANAYANGSLDKDGLLTLRTSDALSPIDAGASDAGAGYAGSYPLHWKGQGSTCK